MGCRVAIMLVAGFINIRAAFISDTRPSDTQEKYKDKSSFFSNFFLIFFEFRKATNFNSRKVFMENIFTLTRNTTLF